MQCLEVLYYTRSVYTRSVYAHTHLHTRVVDFIPIVVVVGVVVEVHRR